MSHWEIHWLTLMWDSYNTCSHRVFEVGRVLLGSPSSGRVSQSQSSRITPRQLSNISKDGELSTSLGNLCSVTLTGKVFTDIQREPLVFQCVPITSGPGPILFSPSRHVFLSTDESPLSLLFSRMSSLNSLSLPSWEKSSIEAKSYWQ